MMLTADSLALEIDGALEMQYTGTALGLGSIRSTGTSKWPVDCRLSCLGPISVALSV